MAHPSVNFRRPILNFQDLATNRATAISPVRRAAPGSCRLDIFMNRDPRFALSRELEPTPSASNRSSRRRWRKTASQRHNAATRKTHRMTAIAQRERPHLGIFWVAQTSYDEARLLAAGCPLDQAEPYGNCLTYGPGHYETWAQWRRDRTVDPALRGIVRSYEYEDWPRGRNRLRPVARSVHRLCGSQAPDTGNDRAPRNPISFACGAHRGQNRLALSEQRNAERARNKSQSALKVGRAVGGGRGASCSSPCRKMACFCSAPTAGIYSAVDRPLMPPSCRFAAGMHSAHTSAKCQRSHLLRPTNATMPD